jgi:hypothetical protein
VLNNRKLKGRVKECEECRLRASAVMRNDQTTRRRRCDVCDSKLKDLGPGLKHTETQETHRMSHLEHFKRMLQAFWVNLNIRNKKLQGGPMAVNLRFSTSLFCSLASMLGFFTFRDIPLSQRALDVINHEYNRLVFKNNIRARYEVEHRANETVEVVSARISADASSTRLVKVMLARDKYPEAVCNDGSPAAFYHQLGLLKSRDWIVHLEVRVAQSGLRRQTSQMPIIRPAKCTPVC